jgi:hypothetical protein
MSLLIIGIIAAICISIITIATIYFNKHPFIEDEYFRKGYNYAAGMLLSKQKTVTQLKDERTDNSSFCTGMNCAIHDWILLSALCAYPSLLKTQEKISDIIREEVTANICSCALGDHAEISGIEDAAKRIFNEWKEFYNR